jgi:hypothetical protein
MEDVDGRALPQEKQWPRQDVVKRFRPWVADDDRGTLVVENLRIHHVTNQKAIDIGLVSHDRVPGKTLCYAKVIVRNCDISQIVRDEVGQKQGLHIDFLRICGGGDEQPIETDVLIEDVYVHDGSALPIIVQDGKYRSITFRRVRIQNTTLSGAQIAVINSGQVREVIVEDSPGLQVALMGKPGGIERAVVRGSPGAKATDVPSVNGRTGARIVYEAGSTPATTAPTTRTATSVKSAVPPKLVVDGDVAAGKIRAAIVGDLPPEAAYVIFETFDREGYRVTMPAIVAEAPWETSLLISKTGRIRVQASIRRVGGAADAPLVTLIDVAEPGGK